MQALRSHEQIRDANTRYHDVAATTYDAKWGIDFGEIGQSQVLRKVRKLLAAEVDAGFASALEVGAGTGYFSLNLMRSGAIAELTCTDISAGMVEALNANAERLELDNVRAIRADGESLPFPDSSFDLVLGHAVLHHLPDLDQAFAEFRRVLRPGGRIVFAGEPSRIGDRIARLPKRAAVTLAPLWRAAVRAAPAAAASAAPGTQEQADYELEREVDIHAFAPADLQRLATLAGFSDVTIRGEELVANWFGWFNRGLEASARPDDVPMWWRRYAFHGYLRLQKLDERVLEPRLPPALFYNLLLTARRPLDA
ncbi:MAG TPA: class I SAM-dependent methyltransferase [Solirubrobacteraceae bacterium]|nr:class I SAM-dependent methyltransferase [Solirubrobacteraceae bacterium]